MLNVKALRSEPFLWIHISGIAVFPIFVGLSAIALSIGNSYNFVLELSLLFILGIAPVLWMQGARPFDIFSILLLSIAPESLSEERREILSLFKTFKHKIFSAIAAIIMTALTWLVYNLSPLATGILDFLPQWRILGLGIAIVCIYASNLFFQIPLSVLLVLLTKETKLSQSKAYGVENIDRDFTVPGIKIDKILWFVRPELDLKENN